MSILSPTSTSQSTTEQLAEPSAKCDHKIKLVDTTKPAHTSANGSPHSSDDEELEAIVRQSTVSSLARLPRNTLRKELARRKYAKWQEDRVSYAGMEPEGSETPGDATDERVEGQEPSGSQDSSIQRKKSKLDRLDRGKQRVKGIIGRKKLAKKLGDDDVAIDVLYENQRGSFFFGIPLFSANSLLNFDPAPWVNATYQPSPTNITNSQVPDPQWQWEWKSWYVDMSQDVDEEGWQYSFTFQKGFSWHGTHPWFHSFVRRRRWLRKRVRLNKHPHIARTASQSRLREAHELTSEYFTIHPSQDRSDDGSALASRGTSLTSPNRLSRALDEEPAEEEIRDIPTLMRCLKKAAIDREKIVLVRKFLEQGGEELHYLAEQMPTIMSLLVFQNSRRQLLAILMRKFDIASDHREALKRRGEDEGDAEKRLIDNLLKAAEAADEECRKMEYWSDVRHMVRLGETLAATDDSAGWAQHDWQGIDQSGPSGMAGHFDHGHGHHPDDGREDEEDGEPAKGQGLKRQLTHPGAFPESSGETESSAPAPNTESPPVPSSLRRRPSHPGAFPDSSEETHTSGETVDTVDTGITSGSGGTNRESEGSGDSHDNDKFRAEDKPGTPDLKGKGRAD